MTNIMTNIKVGQIWYNQEYNDSAVIVKIAPLAEAAVPNTPCVWWYQNGFMNVDSLNECIHGFFQKNGYELVKDKVS